MSRNPPEANGKLKHKIHEIIFEADTPAGKWFDILLLITISASVLVVVLESVDSLNQRFDRLFSILEWTFTVIFSIEYLFRLYCVRYPLRYASSFFGIIDLISVLPTYLALLVAGTQYFLVIRALRLLRIFRIFKLGQFLEEGDIIVKALKASRAKITVFITFVLLLVLIVGSIMYLVEGGTNPRFANIPQSVYWAIVTLTTVGYGDIAPITDLGRFLSAIVMIMGYAVIAVPTGIVSAEFIESRRADLEEKLSTQVCRSCNKEGHDIDADYCKFCGTHLDA